MILRRTFRVLGNFTNLRFDLSKKYNENYEPEYINNLDELLNEVSIGNC